jgi:hypothetical protein
MVLRVGGHVYLQKDGTPVDAGSPPFPYRFYPCELTTWGAWQRAHPETDVYVGRLAPGHATSAG